MADRGRPRRSASRYLAPLALAATCAGIYLIVSDSVSSGSGAHAGGSASAPQHGGSGSDAGTSSTTQTRTTATTTPTTSTGGSGPEFYVVSAGDTLSGIALRTHVSVAMLEQLNPGAVANSLRVGQRLRLRR